MSVLINKSSFDTLCSSVTSNLNTDSTNASTINSNLELFIDNINAGVLKGDMWNTIGQKYFEFSSIMQKRKNAADSFSATVSSAQSKIDGAWDSRFDNEIEDTKLEELENEIHQVESKISSLYGSLAVADNKEMIDYLNGLIATEESILNELKDFLKALIEFLLVYQEVCNELTSAIDSNHTSFGSAASTIQPSVI